MDERSAPPSAGPQDILDMEGIKAHCKEHPKVREWIREVLFFDRISSTNRTALEIAGMGMPGGIAIFAESQTAGRGRLGRLWFSPVGVNLYCSLFLMPHQPVRTFHLFSLATAAALVQAIQSVAECTVQIKWPNDLVIGNQKIAGILLESATIGGQTPPLVIGIGINVNVDEFPPELQTTATSLKIATGKPIDRSALAREMLSALSEQYDALRGSSYHLIETIRPACRTLGKRVSVRTPHNTFEGWADDIESDGALRCRLGDRSIRKIALADILQLREIEEGAAGP
jgi:BirA family biotin operon repressor/biotin-[acetyl-CoA-carboxylase] ligase